MKVTSDDRHLVIGSYQGASDHAEIHVIASAVAARGFGETDTTDVLPLVTGFSAGWHFIDGRDGQLYFRTDADAPFGRIVRFDLRDARSCRRADGGRRNRATRSSTRRWRTDGCSSARSATPAAA